MKTLITTICLIFCLASLSFADMVQIDPNKLTPEQIQQLYALRQAAYPKTSPEIPTPDMFEKYAAIGTAVAKAIGAACKELNVELNEFAKTPVGKLTIAVIIWKVVAAGAFKGFMVTLAWLLVLYLSWRFYKKMFVGTAKSPKYEFSSKDAKTGVAWGTALVPIAMTIIWLCLV